MGFFVSLTKMPERTLRSPANRYLIMVAAENGQMIEMPIQIIREDD